MNIRRLKKTLVLKQRLLVIAAVVLLGLTGIYLLQRSLAAGPFIAAEPESGSLSAGATSVSDSSASGGAAVSFKAASGGTGNNCASTVTPPAGVTSGYSLGFCDDFSGASVDTSKWSFQSTAEGDWSSNPLGTGNLGNQQLEFDQPANCTLSGGILHMTAKRQTVRSQSGKTYNWTSCMINSSPSYAFRYGYLEERTQLPPTKGFWPALWTWAANGVSCSGNCETDVFEYYSDNKTKLYLTQHNAGGGGCTYTLPFDPTTGMHTYGADITPSGTKWYVDGKMVCSVATTAGGNSNILVDNFVYSTIPPDASVNTGDKLIDYVRAWR